MAARQEREHLPGYLAWYGGTIALELKSANGVELRLRTVCNVVLPVECAGLLVAAGPGAAGAAWYACPIERTSGTLGVDWGGGGQFWYLRVSWLGQTIAQVPVCGCGLEGEE